MSNEPGRENPLLVFSLLHSPTTGEEARRMTGNELRTLGLSHVAYCRKAFHGGVALVSIHAADGTPLALAEDERSAMDTIFEQEMEPVLIQ